MLDNREIYEQSLIEHLYYARAIRSFCITIGVSFFGNNEEYIQKAFNLGVIAREIEEESINLANKKIGDIILNSDFYYTPYSIDCELLTEKLFDIDLKSNLEGDIQKLKNKKDFNIDNNIIENINLLNQKGLMLAKDFDTFCLDIKNKLIKQELFSYLYPTFFDYLYDVMHIYLKDLERIIQKIDYAPIYLENYDYYFNEAFKKTAQFVRGFLDTRHQNLFDMSSFYVNAFGKMALKYLKSDDKENLNLETEKLVQNYQKFLSDVIEKLLKSKIYFITPAITIDHFLASVNVYLYIMEYNKNANKENYIL